MQIKGLNRSMMMVCFLCLKRWIFANKINGTFKCIHKCECIGLPLSFGNRQIFLHLVEILPYDKRDHWEQFVEGYPLQMGITG